MKQASRLKLRISLIVSAIIVLFSSKLNGQTITGVSINGATLASGSSNTWNVNWYTNSADTTNATVQLVTLTLSGFSGGDRINMDATNTAKTWQMQFGSISSNAWKTFCYSDVAGATSTYKVYIRNTNNVSGTYTNSITIGVGKCGSSSSSTVTLNVTVQALNAGVYTWVGTSGVDSTYGRALNWSPTRTTPSTSDVLVVNLGSSSSPVNTTIDISGVTQTIGQFKIFPYNTVDFKCTTNNAAWTINGGSGSGDDYIVSPNSVMRKTGGAMLDVKVASGNTAQIDGILHTTDGELRFSGAGTHTISSDIYTVGGNLSFIPSASNMLYLTGATQSINGTGGTLYIDSMMDVTYGTGSSAKLTLNRSLPLYSNLTLLANATVASNKPAGSTASNWRTWEPYLQFKVANKSGAKSRGQLAALPSTASITGGSLFEILGSNVRSYRMFGIPMKNAVNLSQWTDNIDMTGTVSGNNQDSFSTTCSYCVSSAFYWDEPTQSWVAYNSGNTANKINQLQGSMIFFRGTKTNGLGDPTAAANVQVVDFKGELAQGNQSVTLSYTASGATSGLRGLNLIANPYPCAIDWKKVGKPSGFAQKFQVYDSRGKVYNVWDSTVGSLTRSGSSKFTGAAANKSRVIDAGAGFFVQASSTSDVISFTEDCKITVVKGASDQFKTTNESNLRCSELQVGIRFANDSIPENDNSILQFDMNYPAIAATKDDFDTPKIFGGFLGVGTLTDDNAWLSIDRRPTIDATSFIIPLKVKTPEANVYKLTFGTCAGTTRYKMHLMDKLTNRLFPVSDGTEYLFTRTLSDAYNMDRFDLYFLEEGSTNAMSTKNIAKNQFTVYPNPSANGEFNVVANGNNKINKIEVYTFDGRLIKTVNPSNSNAEISKLVLEEKGNFMLKVTGTVNNFNQIIINY